MREGLTRGRGGGRCCFAVSNVRSIGMGKKAVGQNCQGGVAQSSQAGACISARGEQSQTRASLHGAFATRTRIAVLGRSAMIGIGCDPEHKEEQNSSGKPTMQCWRGKCGQPEQDTRYQQPKANGPNSRGSPGAWTLRGFLRSGSIYLNLPHGRHQIGMLLYWCRRNG